MNNNISALATIFTLTLACNSITPCVADNYYQTSPQRSYSAAATARFRQALESDSDVNAAIAAIKQGANPNCVFKIYQSGTLLEMPALSCAVSAQEYALAQCLLEYGAKPDAMGNIPLTPLAVAILDGQSSLVDLLLKHGAKANFSNADIPSYWFFIFELAETPTAMLSITSRMLQAGLDPDYPIQMPMSAEMKEQILNDIVAQMLKSIPNANQLPSEQLLALKQQAREKANQVNAITTYPILLAVSLNQVELVELLLKHGANLESSSNMGTALHTACQQGRTEMCLKLIQKGADINAQTPRGWTPLIRAINDKHPSTAKALIDAGCNVSLRTEDGNSALFFALLNQDIATLRLLFDKGIDYQPNHPMDSKLLTNCLALKNVEAAKLFVDHGALKGADVSIVRAFRKMGGQWAALVE